MKKSICLTCNSEFSTFPSANRKFCSLKCFYAHPKHNCPKCGCYAKEGHICRPNHRLGTHLSKEAKLRISLANKGHKAWNNGLTKEIDSRINTSNGAFKKGHKTWNKGIPRTEEEKKNISEAIKESYHLGNRKLTSNHFHLNHTPHNKGKSKENYEPLRKTSKTKKGVQFTQEHKENIKKTHWSKNERWRDEVLAKMHTPESNQKRFESLMKSFNVQKTPTSYEKKFAELCIELHIPFSYSGQGSFWLKYGNLHKNPDFICEEKKIAVEVFHSFYKLMAFGSIDKYKEYCQNIYTSCGWKVLFIDENDLFSENWKEICFQKIMEVMKSNEN